MAAQIVLNIDNQPGSLARVVAALRRYGLSLDKHQIQSTGNGLSRLIVIVDGPFSARELTERLGDVKGVKQVVSVGPTDGKITFRAQSPRPTEDGRIDGLVQDIVSAFPRILFIVEEYESTLEKGSMRAVYMRELGERVGAKILANDQALQSAGNIHEALQNAVVPALLPISDAEAMGTEVRTSISIFTRRQVDTKDLVFGTASSRCDFMAGLIQGMLNVSPTLPKVKVEEHACRSRGDDYCVFRVLA
ncbi:MAG: hypothetical protein QNI91_04545 [Arenicellales bacterium]|nr:hypothetical protein [Arenicellales bacterium]